jgi:crotonobetainyl-CoA:carnitine CoA-transferase CaiB-like acyl-CoA transferase
VPAPSDTTAALLRSAWASLGGRAGLPGTVEVDGERAGLLSSRLAALPAMLAAVATSTLAASALDGARRGGEPDVVTLDADHIALAARSERYAREGNAGEPAAEQRLFDPLSRFWRTSDGWLRLHANYPWHRERALGVLGCAAEPAAVEQAVRGWGGERLEAALMAAGALGFAVRSPRQWREHPQGRAVRAMPLLHTDTGRGACRRVPAGAAASGRRVLDLTRVIAGPVATRTLAAWGADVLRVDSPQLPELPAQALDMLSGKRSTLLDFSAQADRERVEELLDEADVVVHGYRPGAFDRYELSPRAIWERHPHLSVVTLSAWGASGPWARQRGFDSLVQCPTGIAALEASDGRPGALPAQVLDHATGYLAAAAGLLALAACELGEPTRLVELSLAQTARWLMGAGEGEREPEVELDPDRHMITLTGARRPVRVLAPPGRCGRLVPSWGRATAFGADAAAFRERAESP